MALQLNAMLSKMRFQKGTTDQPRTEVWYRTDCTVFRHIPYEGRRIVTIVQKMLDGSTKTDTYDVADPRALEAINALALPFNMSIGPKANSSLEDETHRIANFFDEWVRKIMNEKNHNIQNDYIRFRFGDCSEFMIPMYSVDFLDATQRYLDELNRIATENQW